MSFQGFDLSKYFDNLQPLIAPYEQIPEQVEAYHLTPTPPKLFMPVSPQASSHPHQGAPSYREFDEFNHAHYTPVPSNPLQLLLDGVGWPSSSGTMDTYYSEPRVSSAAVQSMNAYTGPYGEFGVSEFYAPSPPQVTYPQPAPTHQAALRLQGEPSTAIYLSDNQWPSMIGLPTVHAPLTPPSPPMTLASTASSPSSMASLSSGYFGVPGSARELSTPLHGTYDNEHGPMAIFSPMPPSPLPIAGPSTQQYTIHKGRLIASSRRVAAACAPTSGSGTHYVPSLSPSGLPTGGQKKSNTGYEGYVPNAAINGNTDVFLDNNNNNIDYCGKAVGKHVADNGDELADAVQPAAKRPRVSPSAGLSSARTKTDAKPRRKGVQSKPAAPPLPDPREQHVQQESRKRKHKGDDDDITTISIKPSKKARQAVTQSQHLEGGGSKRSNINKNLFCPFDCRKEAFHSKYERNRHLIESCQRNPDRQEPQLPCPHCGKNLRRVWTLKRHLTPRTGECIRIEKERKTLASAEQR
ncbi:hypothetical protein POSPLADRAFT_1074423 [Postia placenta MAD-698-R-SB12]|uniref:Uncharacterized protein n=1 Tax=Postia placenta MAD-698-R-SB12 TaxID=670580 RepID=A0A1X6N0G2_9APHY|nr:hypothetical protein POSPLADRAFT_1074423 [Postia placenta MAD-698-R-SB12]OSX62098.1 hypothetical protein POSPLADRAFT_1074423 [Postia placenta MAD-698-R-SB12]